MAAPAASLAVWSRNFLRLTLSEDGFWSLMASPSSMFWWDYFPAPYRRGTAESAAFRMAISLPHKPRSAIGVARPDRDYQMLRAANPWPHPNALARSGSRTVPLQSRPALSQLMSRRLADRRTKPVAPDSACEPRAVSGAPALRKASGGGPAPGTLPIGFVFGSVFRA